MGRSDWLTDIAKPIAELLAARCGSLKKVFSAGVMALNDLPAEKREYYMAKADGVELKPSTPGTSTSRQQLHNIIIGMKEMVEVERQQPGTVYKVLDREEQKITEEFRQLMAPKKSVKQAKRA